MMKQPVRTNVSDFIKSMMGSQFIREITPGILILKQSGFWTILRTCSELRSAPISSVS